MQAIDGLTKTLLVLQFLWFAVANGQDYNVTTSTEDYVIQNKRQYANNILAYDAQLAVFRSSYTKQAQTIDVQRDLLEVRFLDVDARLNPLEVLNDHNKHCVQKYRKGIPIWATVKTTLTNCAATAISYLSTLLSSPQTTRGNLDSYYKTTLETNLNNCQKNHPSSQFNYTNCVTQTINTANTYTIANQKTFATQMDTAECSADGRINTALDCSFTSQFTTITAIGETNRLIDNCIAGLEYCPPCSSSYCPTYDVEISAADYFNATMRNPLYGLNETVSCVQLNFYNSQH